MGNRNSIPASSASFARAILFSHEFTHRSGTLVTDIPPEQLGEKNPSFNLFSFRIGDCLRPMHTSIAFSRSRKLIIYACAIIPTKSLESSRTSQLLLHPAVDD